jgi:hypothetical protein
MNENDQKKQITLLDISKELSETLSTFQEINNRGNIISLNAAIEGARMKGKFPTFSIVANQIQEQSLKNNELMQHLQALAKKINDVSLAATAARYFELAEDLIDKVDRNLFERNCDVQAWATFESIIHLAKYCLNFHQEQILTSCKNSSSEMTISHNTLEKLVDTYMVYHEAIVTNNIGYIIGCAKNKTLIGTDCSEEVWFKISSQGEIHVSDVELCSLTKKLSVMYSSPIYDENKVVIGIVSTRFTWDYAQEMIDSFFVDEKTRAYYVNKDSQVIASTKKLGVMKDSLHWLDGGVAATDGRSGFSLENDRNGAPLAVGFSRTKGYNAYRGKDWSCIICSKISYVNFENFISIVKKTNIENELTLIESETANNALQMTMKSVEALVQKININNRESKFLAINASIQSGIAGEEGDGFAIIANEIGFLAKKSLDFVMKVNVVANNLKSVVSDTLDKRLLDAAKDAIDKVDRNLFERYCDVQAWTTFKLFKDVLTDSSLKHDACELARRLHQIYEVYYEVVLLNVAGDIVATAKDHSLIGQNQLDREWFKHALAGKVFFSDVYFSTTVNHPTVAFSSPIFDDEGTIIGVLSTRFNCQFLNDILKSVIIDSKSSVYLSNDSGILIASEDGSNVLDHEFDKQMIRDIYLSKNGIREEEIVDVGKVKLGYCVGNGYNSYKGKGWAILIQRSI